MTPNQPNASSARSAHAPGLFPRTRRSLALGRARLETRRRIIRELALLSDRALADMGIYRWDISAFAHQATAGRHSEPLFRALLTDLRGLGRSGPARAFRPNAAE
jgi:uncharacterized protein YjiS (DUF1127 family)